MFSVNSERTNTLCKHHITLSVAKVLSPGIIECTTWECTLYNPNLCVEANSRHFINTMSRVSQLLAQSYKVCSKYRACPYTFKKRKINKFSIFICEPLSYLPLSYFIYLVFDLFKFAMCTRVLKHHLRQPKCFVLGFVLMGYYTYFKLT